MVKKKRTYNINLIKDTLLYSVYEIAELFHIHKATVRHWLKNGLKTIDDRRPYYVRGSDLKAFLKTKRESRKRPCQPDEFYCLRCRQPRKPRNLEVIMVKYSDKVWLLKGLCSVCSAKMNKRISAKKADELGRIFRIIKIHDKDLSVSEHPIPNTHLEKGALS